jgi:hypothetical protein
MISSHVAFMVLHVMWVSLVLRWLGLDWKHMGWVPNVSMSFGVEIWLHLEHKVSIDNVGLAGTEGCTVSIEGGVVTLVPSVGVEGVEVILPVEIESLGLAIPSVSLNIVVVDIPWHFLVVEAFAPRVKGCSYVSATSERFPGPKFCPLTLQISPGL